MVRGITLFMGRIREVLFTDIQQGTESMKFNKFIQPIHKPILIEKTAINFNFQTSKPEIFTIDAR